MDWLAWLDAKPWLRLLAGAAVIAVLSWLSYRPSTNGGFILDDAGLLAENPTVCQADGLYRIWCTKESPDYWPVTYTTFWVEWRLWGDHPTGYHVVNLLLHIASASLLWRVLERLSIPGAFLAALIFAVHPVNVESVAWIAQCKNLLAMVFFLMSIRANLEVKGQPPPERFRLYPSGSGRWYWLSLIAFVLAMLSKGSVAVLPVILLGIVAWRREITVNDFLQVLPFFAVAAILTGVNVWFQTHGSGEIIRHATFLERLLGAAAAVWFYLYKAILPIDLVFVYPRWSIQTENWLWWLPLAAAIVVTVLLWRSRYGWARPIFFAWMYFNVALLPVMGFADVGFMKYSLIADHYQHLALLGVIVLAAAGWAVWRQRAGETGRLIASGAAAVLVGTFALLTTEQNKIYQNAETLYRATLERNPECSLAYNNLGRELEKAGQIREAAECYQKAVELNLNFANAQNNLGQLLSREGQLPEAIEHLKRAIECDSRYPEAHCNLGWTLTQVGRCDEAIKHYQTAVELTPNYPAAHHNWGCTLAAMERFSEAIGHFKEALRLDPTFLPARNNLTTLLMRFDRLPEAIEHLKGGLKLDPKLVEYHNNLGLALSRSGKTSEAIEHYLEVVRLQPDRLDACFQLATAYHRTGDDGKAIAAAEKALRLAQATGQAAAAEEIESWLRSISHK